jgi:superfamily I DNA/RNA helicase
MAQLMMSSQVLKHYHRLPSKVQKRVAEPIDAFQRDPYADAIGLHPLTETMLDPKVHGVTKLPDGYRAIVIAPEKEDTYILVHIDSHDRAYQWARHKRFEVHQMTGVFQIFDAEEMQEQAQDTPPPDDRTSTYALSQLSDDELFAAGVPKLLIPSVRSIHSDDDLERLSDYLPPDCRDVLHGLAAGMSLDEALAEMLGVTGEEPTPESPGDFTRLHTAPNFELVLVEGEEELKQILEASLQAWRLLLHPMQRQLVERNTAGPMNITGAAGTGKTVVLMHRAVRLARDLHDTAARVLVTTFTTNLSYTLRDHIRQLGPDVADRIEVTNLHALAWTICSRCHWKGRIADDDDMAQVWDDVWQDPSLGELPMSKDELQAEYDLVIDPNGIHDEEAYLGTVRSGRPRMSRGQRRQAWQVFRAVQRRLKKRDLLTFEGAIHEARLAVELGNIPRYAHVLVDEVQDFSLEALRLIRALSPIDDNTANPLCTVGDGHQRIYRNKIPMSRAGIDIRGRRSQRLKVNYRTSEQIRQYAQGILEGLDIDDLDGGTAVTVGDHSLFTGPAPSLQICADAQAEAEAIVAWVQDRLTDQGLATHEICITPYKAPIRTALEAAGIPTFELKPREMDPGEEEPGVRLGSMHRIKGLEFRAVVLACGDVDDPMHRLHEAESRERCTRYVAVTRAREYLLVTVCEPPAA